MVVFWRDMLNISLGEQLMTGIRVIFNSLMFVRKRFVFMKCSNDSILIQLQLILQAIS